MLVLLRLDGSRNNNIVVLIGLGFPFIDCYKKYVPKAIISCHILHD